MHLLLLLLAAEPFAGWSQRFARGGSIWELREATCEVVSVKPRRNHGAFVEGRDWSMEGVFEFSQARARLQGAMRWSADGGLGVSGTSAITEPLEVTERTLRISGRVLYLDQTECARQVKAP